MIMGDSVAVVYLVVSQLVSLNRPSMAFTLNPKIWAGESFARRSLKAERS